MNNQRFALAAMVLGGFCFATTGCLLGDDPNKNSIVFGAQGGSTGNGGGGSGGGAAMLPDPPIGSPLAMFDTSTDPFMFSMYDEPTNLAVHYTGSVPPSLEFDATDASPSSPPVGSLKVFAPYSGANQYVDVQARAFPPTALQNWVGGKLHVRVKVDTGSTFSGQIEPYADTTGAYTFVGTSINVMMGGGWKDYVVPLDTAMTRNAGYDLKQVITYGVHIGSGGGGASQQPVTFHIDSFTLEGVTLPTADAGTDTGGGSDAASGN